MIKITDVAERIRDAAIINDVATETNTDAFKLVDIKIDFRAKIIKATWERHDSVNGAGSSSMITLPFRGARLKRILTAQTNTGLNAIKTLRTVLDKALVHYGDFPEVGINLDTKIAEDATLPDELDGYGDDLPDEE